jgi:transposase-like protein
MQKAGGDDFLRSVAEAVVQLLMETDVDGLIGAGRHERSGERTTYRNGYRDRTLDTRLGSLQLRIPKLRQGSYFPPFLEPRKTAEKADSDDVGRAFRLMSATYSERSRPAVPIDVGRGGGAPAGRL